MSVLDDLRAAEERVAQRLKELEPAVAEYRELEAVAQRLRIDVAEPKAADPARPRRSRRTPARPAANGAKKPRGGGRRGNVRPGQRAEQLIELVKARPGITVREIGAELGVDPTSLYRVVHRLEANGSVRKKGQALEPVATTK
jgi:Homeodomain-like domain